MKVTIDSTPAQKKAALEKAQQRLAEAQKQVVAESLFASWTRIRILTQEVRDHRNRVSYLKSIML